MKAFPLLLACTCVFAGDLPSRPTIPFPILRQPIDLGSAIGPSTELNAAVSRDGAAEDSCWKNPFSISETDRVGIWSLASVGDDLIVAGNFGSIGGTPLRNIARWDGAQWRPLAGGLGNENDVIIALATSGTDLYAAGMFVDSATGTPTNPQRWDGNRWSGVGGGVDGTIFALALDGTNLYAGGRFNHAGANAALNIARWDGFNWQPLGGGISRRAECCDSTEYSEVGSVRAILPHGGQIYVCGDFRTAGGVPATNIACWNGTAWTSLAGGLDGPADALTALGSDIYAGGAFNHAGPIAATNVAKWSGQEWSSLGTGVEDGFGVQALASDGLSVYAGGAFRKIGGRLAPRIARWDGKEWSSLGSGIQPDGLGVGVGQLACNGTEVYVAGVFDEAGKVGATNLAVWHVPRKLKSTIVGKTLTLSWPAADDQFNPEMTTHLNPGTWYRMSTSPTVVRDRLTISTPVREAAASYRLKRE